MECPQCGEQMEEGNVFIRGTFWGFLLVGWSLQHCWFRPKAGGESAMVIRNATHFWRRPEWPEGLRCDHCGAVIIRGEREEP